MQLERDVLFQIGEIHTAVNVVAQNAYVVRNFGNGLFHVRVILDELELLVNERVERRFRAVGHAVSVQTQLLREKRRAVVDLVTHFDRGQRLAVFRLRRRKEETDALAFRRPREIAREPFGPLLIGEPLFDFADFVPLVPVRVRNRLRVRRPLFPPVVRDRRAGQTADRILFSVERYARFRRERANEFFARRKIAKRNGRRVRREKNAARDKPVRQRKFARRLVKVDRSDVRRRIEQPVGRPGRVRRNGRGRKGRERG